MGSIDRMCAFRRLRRLAGRSIAHLSRIGLAFALVFSLSSVHAELARAEASPVPVLTEVVLDVAYPHQTSALEQAAHLAGHLTGVVAATAIDDPARDAALARRPLEADDFPRSTALPAPAEPPRA